MYDAAASSLNNRQDQLDHCAEVIEKELHLLGATAIEDKLQDGVPDAIYTLMEAGIKMWVLTGDRQETAINIGYSCKLLTTDMNILLCNFDTHFELKEYLEQKLINVKSSMGISHIPPRHDMGFWNRFWRNKSASDNGKFNKTYGNDNDPLALVIDGKSLKFALESDICEIFLELAILCKAVICCRVSPLQKALVVQLVKDYVASSVTLAIGVSSFLTLGWYLKTLILGANDVSMIQTAHVSLN
jgi:phospholipid-transporting ATPase